MKLIFMLLMLMLLTCFSFGQHALFGTIESPQDTVQLISDGAANKLSYWYAWDDWKEFEGAVGLWHAVYSFSDGISVTLYLSYRTKSGEDNTSNDRVTDWTSLDSLTTSDDTSIRYGAGAQIGQTVSLGDQITNWTANTDIQFRWNWTTSGADTAEIHSVILPVEINY